MARAAGRGPSIGRRLYRLARMVLGPAQLGRSDEPPPDPDRPAPDPACSLCGRPTSEHAVVTVEGRTHMRCPA